MKVATTAQLLRLISTNEARGYNRGVDENFLRELDSNGLHVLTVLMWHEHKDGQSCEPHYRIMVYAKLRDRDTPERVFLDVDINEYDSLPDGEIFTTIASLKKIEDDLVN